MAVKQLCLYLGIFRMCVFICSHNVIRELELHKYVGTIRLHILQQVEAEDGFMSNGVWSMCQASGCAELIHRGVTYIWY